MYITDYDPIGKYLYVDSEIKFSEIKYLNEIPNADDYKIMYSGPSYQRRSDNGLFLKMPKFHDINNVEFIGLIINVLNALGVEKLIFINAVTSLSKSIKIGDILVVDDHINLFPVSPLGQYKGNEKYNNLINCYDSTINQKIINFENEANNRIVLKSNYLGALGPSGATKLEYENYKKMGADTIGFDTVLEVVFARYSNMKCACISIVCSNVF